jgi:aspartate racemase
VRTIGLIGGMSWESSAVSYRFVNEIVRDRCGGFHSADVLLLSVDFAAVEVLQREDRWDEAGALLADAARRLERGGAELLVLCTNTMHEVWDAVTGATELPAIHIADPTADAIEAAGLRRVGLLATRYTMERPFYRDRLAARGIEVLVPHEPGRTRVHDVIYEELVLGEVRDASRAEYLEVVDRLRDRGAEGLILGCTEIDLLLSPGDVPLPVFDTTWLQAAAAVDLALA